jgi:CDP-4-dehydro-6-deoxyglucose reductase, E3
VTGGCIVHVSNDGSEFSCGDEYILDAALVQGIRLPHNCRGGACGTCKADILEGAVDHGWVMSFAISDEEKAAGKCLICVSKPASERLVIRLHRALPPSGGSLASPPAVYETLVVAAHDVTQSVREITVALPSESPFRFDAGQHLEVFADGIEPPRPYSIATAPDPEGRAPDGLLTLYVTRHEAGRASSWIHRNVRAGRALHIRGPYGSFRAPPAIDGDILMIAGGSGLAPILSMLRKLLAGGHAGRIDLLFSVRTAEEVFALGELVALERRHANFRLRLFVTRTPGAALPEGWQAGRIPAALAHAGDSLGGIKIFIAGSPSFVEACCEAALRCGAGSADITSESYESRGAMPATPQAPAFRISSLG